MSAFRSKDRYHFDLTSMGVIDDMSSEDLWNMAYRLPPTSSQGMNLLTLATTKSFLESARQVFELEQGLLSLFDRTDMGKLTGEMVQLPYPCFYVHLVQGDSPLLEFEIQGSSERVAVTGMYVCEHADGQWVIALVHASRERARPAALSWIWDHAKWTQSEETFDAYTARVLGEALEGEHAHVYLGSLRILTHLLLYLSSSEPDVEHAQDATLNRLVKSTYKHKGRRRAQSQRQLDEEFSAARAITYVGRSFTQQDTLASSDGSGQDESHATHWVRGHWHRYWVGPKGKQKLEPRWVQPFKRGEGETVPTRTYKVREGEGDKTR